MRNDLKFSCISEKKVVMAVPMEGMAAQIGVYEHFLVYIWCSRRSTSDKPWSFHDG